MEGLAGYIATGLVSLTVGVLLTHFRPKAKVVWWTPHSFLFNLQDEGVALQTDALTLQNVGRSQADDVEVVLNHPPDFYQLSPSIPYEEDQTPKGNFVLRIDHLGPKEVVTVQFLSYAQVPNLLNLRSSAGQAEQMNIQFQRVFPSWSNYSVVALTLVGIGTVLYWLIELGARFIG